MKLHDLEVFRYKLPLNRPIQLKKVSLLNREGLLIKITDSSKNSIWAEVAPLPTFSSDSIIHSLLELKRLKPFILDHDWHVDHLLYCPNSLSQQSDLTRFPSLFFALEFGVYQLLKPTTKSNILFPVNALLTGTIEQIIQKIKTIEPNQTVKLKIGNRKNKAAVDFVNKVIEHLNNNPIRLDINRSWTTKEAHFFLSSFDLDTFEYIEEPLANPYELPILSQTHLHPIAFDESLTDLPLDVLLQTKTKKAFVLKPPIIGALNALFSLIEIAKKNNLYCVLSSIYESGIGILSMTQLASRFNLQSIPMGLDSYSFLQHDVLKPNLSFTNGSLKIDNQNLPIFNFAYLEKVHV